MSDTKILWVDDEIDLLKPHIMFLKKKGYQIDKCNNGADAIDLCLNNSYDAVLLDENMPGLNGLETLVSIKSSNPNLPVIMITKNEEEFLMEEAIGNKIADYLIKPVNPNQILLSLKKNLDHSRLITEKITSNYQQEFRQIAMDLMSIKTKEEWINIYQKLLYWELELESINEPAMMEILESQKQEANSLFFKFIKNNYESWIQGSNDAPLFSYELLQKIVFPEVEKSNGTLLVLIDNMRYDQFKVLEKTINNYYKKEDEHVYFSILPTATQYARNAIFSGLTPLQMQKRLPDLWKNDTDEGGKNLHEEEFLYENLKRNRKAYKWKYFKITSLKSGKQLVDNFMNWKDNDLTVVVYNFVDMLSHAKTEMEVIKELAGDDKAYRSLTESWFKNSPLLELIQIAQKTGLKLILTTDHGTINSTTPSKVIGDKNISSNLRYKTGKSLSYDDKEVYAVKNPSDLELPSIHLNSSFIFAKENYFFAYPNNYNHFVKYYKNTYQHGGISLEEMIIPCAIFAPK